MNVSGEPDDAFRTRFDCHFCPGAQCPPGQVQWQVQWSVRTSNLRRVLICCFQCHL